MAEGSRRELKLSKYFVYSQLLCNKTNYIINILFRVAPICRYCNASLLQTPHIQTKENMCRSQLKYNSKLVI